jgi:hypothetical protein
VPTPSSLTGFNWFYLSSSISTSPRVIVGPYTVPGTYTYIAEYTNTCGTFRDTVNVIASSTVPVNLTLFEAKAVENSAILRWQTASETDNDYFIIERSADGRLFESIGKVEGNGTTNRTSSYQYLDKDIANSGNVFYYRLQQVDKDGTVDYSSVVSVAFENNEADFTALVLPNPASKETFVLLQGVDNGKITVEVFDIHGKLLSTQSENISNSGKTIQLQNVEILEKGMYFVHVNTNGQSRVVKLLKQPN